MISLEGGLYRPFQFTWPPEMVGQDDATVAQAIIIMRRQGGALLGLPVGFLPLDVLQRAAMEEGEDWDFGPHALLSVPAHREDGQLVPSGVEVEVLVIDVSGAALGGLQQLSIDGVTLSFLEDPALVPEPSVLLQKTKEWLANQTAARVGLVGFYSAVEEVVPETPLEEESVEELDFQPGAAALPKAPAGKQKRVTTAVLAEQLGSVTQILPQLVTQLENLQRNQDALQEQVASQQHVVPPRPSQQPVSTSLQEFAKMMGTPPRVKSQMPFPRPVVKSPLTPKMDSPLTLQEQAEEAELPAGSTLAQAVLEQSKALTTLVTQLQSGGDPLLDAPSSSSGFSLGSKGSAGRMQLQTELSNRSGAFFLQVAQNASRRLRPAAKAPVDIPAVASTDFSMVTYLERFGGYGGCRELGLVQYCLAHIFDAALHSDLEGVREHLALTMVAVEQATQDSGRWDLAYQLTLLEDPPSQMWAFRSGGSMNPRLRAFAPLCPQKWATIALAYLKEVDYIQSRKSDLKKPPTAAAGSPDAALTPSPKRKRNPKGRPREGAEEQQQDK